MRFLRTFGRLIILAVLAALGTAIAWLQFVGFGPGITGHIAQSLSIGTMDVDIGRLTFSPFDGFVAENVNVQAPTPSGTPLKVTVNRITISPNLAALIAGGFTADTLRVEGGQVDIPFADDGQTPASIPLKILEAEIHQSRNELRISTAKMEALGMRLNVRGTFFNLDSLKQPKPQNPSRSENRAATIRSVLATLEEIEFSGTPTIEIECSGDLSDLNTLQAERIHASAGPARFREVRIDGITLDADYQERTITLQRLQIRGPDTDLRVTGDWNGTELTGEFELDGNFHPASIVASSGRPELSDEVRFLGATALSALISAKGGASGLQLKASGRLESGAFQLKKLGAKSFRADFAWDQGRLYSRDAQLVLSSGIIHADVLSAPNDFRLRLKSNAIPTEILSLLGKYERAVLELMEFKDAPELEVTVRGTRPNFDSISGTGTVRLGRTAMRGSWIDSAEAKLVIADRAVIYKDIVLRKGDQRGTGAFTYDFGRREVRLDKIESTLMPYEILLWVDQRIADTIAAYDFRGPPKVRADGMVHMKDPTKNDLKIRVDAKAGLNYELIGKKLPFGATQANVHLLGQKVIADVQKSELYGGSVSVLAEVSTNPENPTISAKLKVDQVDFPSITKRYFGYERSKGFMTGAYDFTAQLKDEASMRGKGSIRVEDGAVLSIPVFGPLSEIISTIIPGAGHESARLAKADFTIAKRLITTDNLEIEGNGFSLFGDGNVRYPSGDMDLTVRINARGIPGIVFFPVSKLLEYVSTGTVSDPQWRPKIVPKEFFDILGMSGNSATPAPAPSPTKSRPTAPKIR